MERKRTQNFAYLTKTKFKHFQTRFVNSNLYFEQEHKLRNFIIKNKISYNNKKLPR